MSAECPTCGESFAHEQGMKVHHTRKHGSLDETTCQECGSTFIPSNNSHGKYCSLECTHESQRETDTRECDMCGRSFRVKPSSPTSYCCRSCWAEADHNRPRPDELESVLWVLYRYEGFSIVETYRRHRAVLGIDECLTETEVREKIHDMGIARDYNTARWTLQDLDPDEVGESAPTGDESYKQFYQEA